MGSILNFFTETLQDPLFSSLIIVGLGLLVGVIKINGINLGIAGIFIVGMVCGFFGMTTPDDLTLFGLLTFIYVIGIQGGSAFFNSMSKKGLPYLFVTLVMTGMSSIACIIFGKLLGMNNNDIVGVYNGALNNSAGLAILMENPQWGKAPLPSYGLTFPIGVVATVIAVQLIPKLLKKNMLQEYQKIKEQEQLNEKKISRVMSSKFIVENADIIGKTLKELNFSSKIGATIEVIKKHGEETLTLPTADTVLEENDIIKVNGTEESLKEFSKTIGRKTFERMSDPNITSARIVMTNHTIHHKKLYETDIPKKSIIVTKVERAGISFRPSYNFVLELGDILIVVGRKKDVERAEKYIGKAGVTSPGVDIISLALGCGIGIMLGKINIPIPYLGTFTLGSAGGALFVGLFLGYMHRFGIFTNQISQQAKNVIKDIGISIFLAGVGTSSGAALIGIDTNGMSKMFILAFLILIVTISSVFYYSFKIAKMDFIKSLACLSGIMYQSAAIITVNTAVHSEEPTEYFATCYPLATFGVIISAQLVAQILLLIG